MLMEIRQYFGQATGPKVFAGMLRSVFAEQHPFDQDQEQIYVIGLNTRHAIKYVDLVSMGTIDCSVLHPREVFRQAVAFGVAKIAVAHNHPSGEVEPSQEDIYLTGQLIKAGDVLGISVMDHLIVSTRNEDVYSVREEHPELGWHIR